MCRGYFRLAMSETNPAYRVSVDFQTGLKQKSQAICPGVFVQKEYENKLYLYPITGL